MAENIPCAPGGKQEPKALFSVNIVNNQFVVADSSNSGSTVHENTREHYNNCLKNFETALAHVNNSEYDKHVISQLLVNNFRLALCVPNRRIEELELSQAPLRHELAAYQDIVGTGIGDADELSQQAAAGASGESLRSTCQIFQSTCTPSIIYQNKIIALYI